MKWTQWIYLLATLFSISGLMYADYRYKLALFWQPRRVLAILGIGIGFFLAWDVTGIVLDVFSTNPQWVSGLYVITPDLPIEEFAFLTLLNYQTIILWRISCLRTH